VAILILVFQMRTYTCFNASNESDDFWENFDVRTYLSQSKFERKVLNYSTLNTKDYKSIKRILFTFVLKIIIGAILIDKHFVPNHYC